jgi:four helix bundle protein
MARLYKNIRAYHLAYQFTLDIYDVTDTFPKSERNNLISQLRRAAVSIPLNIAEGSAKASHKEFTYFLNVAYGSAKEIEVLLSLSYDLGFLNKKEYDQLDNQLDELNAKLYLFIRSIESRIKSNRYQFFKKFDEK